MQPGPSGQRRITLADVARAAGVSVQTASHVLSGTKGVRLPQSTRDRVLAAAKEVGYRPNRLAQAMKRGRTHVVSVWMPVDRPILTHLWFLKAIHEQASHHGYELMITGLQGSMAYSAKGTEPHSWPVDGVIALDAGKAISHFRSDPRNDDIPTVVLGLEEYKNSDSVGWDVRDAAARATQRLIDLGCRRIVQVTLDWVLSDYPREQRRRGYSETLVAAGLEPEFVSVEGEGSSPAEAAVLTYISANGAPDAFFCFTDPLAIGTARAVLDSGRKIPDDCLIWGYGGYPEAADFKVPLSSIRMPIDAVVEQAWTWLTERIADPSLAGRQVNLPMELIERDSSLR